MNKRAFLLILIILASVQSFSVSAESLFRANVSQSDYYYQPRSLFVSNRAKTVGDLVTVNVIHEINTSDSVTLSAKKNSEVTDGFSTILNSILNRKLFPNVDSYGGTNQTSNNSSLVRKTKFTDTVAAQVVQVLPNGNLLIQGKKTSINAGEKLDLMVSGIVDPRFLDKAGAISSTQIANFQIAVTGKGTVSGLDSEGALNRYIKYLY